MPLPMTMTSYCADARLSRQLAASRKASTRGGIMCVCAAGRWAARGGVRERGGPVGQVCRVATRRVVSSAIHAACAGECAEHARGVVCRRRGTPALSCCGTPRFPLAAPRNCRQYNVPCYTSMAACLPHTQPGASAPRQLALAARPARIQAFQAAAPGRQRRQPGVPRHVQLAQRQRAQLLRQPTRLQLVQPQAQEAQRGERRRRRRNRRDGVDALREGGGGGACAAG